MYDALDFQPLPLTPEKVDIWMSVCRLYKITQPKVPEKYSLAFFKNESVEPAYLRTF
jgi:hypothetical protein